MNGEGVPRFYGSADIANYLAGLPEKDFKRCIEAWQDFVSDMPKRPTP